LPLIWAAAGFLVVVALATVLARRPLADLQSMLAGGTVLPGCVIAEAAVFLLLAVAIVLLYRAGALTAR